MPSNHIRHGFGAVRPYVYGRMDSVNLLHIAFGAEVLERLQSPNGVHIEARIGDDWKLPNRGHLEEQRLQFTSMFRMSTRAYEVRGMLGFRSLLRPKTSRIRSELGA